MAFQILKYQRSNYLASRGSAASPTRETKTGWVLYAGTPVLWRSSQNTTALSTAEAELTLLWKAAQRCWEWSLLSEEVGDRMVGSDSSAGTVTGSWRTRHLRVKASWLQAASAAGCVRDPAASGPSNQGPPK